MASEPIYIALRRAQARIEELERERIALLAEIRKLKNERPP